DEGVMYSIHDSQGWSAPALLPITGLEPGGQFGEVAIGSASPGRIDVLFDYTLPNANQQHGTTILYNPPTSQADFTSPATPEVVTQGGAISNLQGVANPPGGLIASWMGRDGDRDEVFASSLSAPPGSVWSTPTALTSGHELKHDPALAVE